MSSQIISARQIQTWADWEAAVLDGCCTEAEKKLVAACQAGRVCKLGDGKRPIAAESKNEIGADLLRYLIKGGCDDGEFHNWGVDLEGGYITGSLDLRLLKVGGITGMTNCRFEAPINALNVSLEMLILNGSSCRKIFAQGAKVKGAIFLREGFEAAGEVNLSGAIIGGQLSCTDSRFENQEGYGLNLQAAEVKNGIFLTGSFVAKGGVNLSSAVIGGQLACVGGRFISRSRDAINAQGAEVKGDVILSSGFAATGEVSLAGIMIGGQLVCSGGSFSNTGGLALNVQGAVVKGDVVLREGFEAKGRVSFGGAMLGGQISCTDGRFLNEGGIAFDAQSINVKGDVFFSEDFVSDGDVNITGAVIGGQLTCSGGSFKNAEGYALIAQSVEVRGGVFMSNGFSAKGGVSFTSALIGGQLTCAGGSFENAKGCALEAQGAEIKGDVILRAGFQGEVRLSGATINGQLSCSGGSFENQEGDALDAEGAQLTGFQWCAVESCVGRINLQGARALDLNDDASSWAMVNRVQLDGFEYQVINGPLSSGMRLDWLKTTCASDGTFSPQPYEQLAQIMKRMGHGELRRYILVEKEKRHRSYERESLRRRCRFARLLSLWSKNQDQESLKAVVKYTEMLGSEHADYANDLVNRYRLFHMSWPQSAQRNGISSEDIARAQAGYREELFSSIWRIRMLIAWLQTKDYMASHLAGYGYRPFKFVWVLFLLVLIGWVTAHKAYENGDFAPNSDVILSTTDWQKLAQGESSNPARDWAARTGKGRDYETFNSFAYALDIVIPLVALGQEAAWAPSTNRGHWGARLWWLRWILVISGWIVTAVGAAALTGIIRRE